MTRAKYNIKYISAKDLNLIQDKWRALQIGEEMTMFQSFEWYQMLLEHYIPNDTRNFESVFAIVESDGKPCMIAPLWIVKRTFRLINKKGIYLIGQNSFSDYLNFIYLHFNHDGFDFLLKELYKKYGVDYFVFDSVREATSIYRHILKTYHIDKDSSAPCVNLSLPLSVENYHKMLSKNSRQNIRTANNRLVKDRKKLFFNFDDQQVDKDKCLEIRDAKLAVKYAQFSLIRKYKYRIINRLRYSFPYFTPIKYYSESKIMTAYDEEGNLRAFFNYGFDTEGTCIRVMAAGTDLDFARYSPGILLMYNFILKAIQEGNIREIDFTRGDEKYKFSLGGKLRTNHTVRFHFK